MTSEPGSLTERLQRSLPALRALVDEVVTLPGEPARGTDAASSVHVVLAPDGLPHSIRVDGGWRGTVGAAGLAAAVTEACQSAVVDHSHRVTTAVERHRWSDRVVDALAHLAGDGPPPPDLPVHGRSPGPSIARADPVGTRSLLAVIDHIAPAEPGDAGTLPDPARTDRTGSGAFGRLGLTLAGLGVIVCEADEAWVARQSTDDLNDALATALAALRAAADSDDPEGLHGPA